MTALRDLLAKILHGREHVTLEIGSGHGHYLTAFAAAHPSRFCLGIDIMSDRLIRSERKQTRARLSNLVFVHASADDLLAALPEHLVLDDILILFPDPWPKRRHHKNRLIQADFLTRLANRSAPGAHLYFRTDFSEYFSSAQAVVRTHPCWKIPPSTTWPFEMPTVFQTRASAYESLIAIRT